MITVRQADARGHSNFGWLDSHHTFSFGEYQDPRHMGFSALRVINDDTVTPGAGFGTHGHRDMEIISCVLEGVIAHKDSEGNVANLRPGEFQLMSAGSGIRHSEFNPSDSDKLHFLQIWIQPRVFGQTPGYQQKEFAQKSGLTLVASPDGAQGSLVIKQDARMYQLVLPAQAEQKVPVQNGRKVWVHVIDGNLAVGGEQLKPGDGAAIDDVAELQLVAGTSPVRALVFDLP
jgi:quercetin 2,3-dioxygenase